MRRINKSALLCVSTAFALKYSLLKEKARCVDDSSSKSKQRTVLVADIGGTNSRLQLFSIDPNETSKRNLIDSKSYKNENFDTFRSVYEEFMSSSTSPTSLNKSRFVSPSVMCLAVAGPVKDNKVTFTNRSNWVIDGSELSRELKIPRVRLMNDFVANGYGLLTLDIEKDCVVLQRGKRDETAPIACLGAGTGLGECFLTPNHAVNNIKISNDPNHLNTSYICYPSEGGHSEYAPRNDLEYELLKYLKTKFNQKHRVSVERVVSGSGIENIYEFLCSAHPEQVDPVIHKRIMEANDKARAISESVSECFLCSQSLSVFVSAYGAEAGVAALKWLPLGGLFLAGGITPKQIHRIKQEDGPFMQALLDKGRVSPILKDIPVYAVIVEDLGTRGALHCAEADLKSLLA